VSCPRGHQVPQAALRYENGVAICPVCWPVTETKTRVASHWRVILTVGMVAGVGLVFAAFLMAFIPLPTQEGGFGWCGPGASSESAVVVRINPDSVNSGFGVDTSTPEYQQQARQFKALCEGVADTRLQECAVLLFVGAALAVASVAFLTYRPRWLLDT
jgi:hypothetical protein